MNPEDEKFEDLLKDSLRELREAEPRMGLEARILANATSADRQERTVWWKWAAVAAMVILIVLGIAVYRGTKNDVVEIHPTRTVPEMPKSSPPSKDAQAKGIIARGPVSGRKKYAASNTSRSTNPSQKLESATAKIPFPAPAPLNEQEKALVMLAQNHPQVVKSVAVDSTSDDPLAIPKLKIEPIEVSENREEER